MTQHNICIWKGFSNSKSKLLAVIILCKRKTCQMNCNFSLINKYNSNVYFKTKRWISSTPKVTHFYYPLGNIMQYQRVIFGSVYYPALYETMKVTKMHQSLQGYIYFWIAKYISATVFITFKIGNKWYLIISVFII